MYFNILIFVVIISNFKATYQDAPKIKEYIVKTFVANRFAETTILSEVENDDTSTKQSTFSVVFPEGAFISGFSMKIDGKIYKSFVERSEETENTHDQPGKNQSDGYVAVYTRNSKRFTVNVDIEPKSKINFNLTYEELLQRDKGQYEIITNIQPGQIVRNLAVEVEIKDSNNLLFVRTPPLQSGNNAVIQNSSQLDPQASVKIFNTSATVKFQPDLERQLQSACAGLGHNEYEGFAGQFVVQYDIERVAQGGETLFQDEFFVNFFAPSNLKPIPKHIVFVLDTSGSMRNARIIQLKIGMLSILSQLDSGDLLSIVQYGETVFLWDLNLKSHDVIPAFPEYGNLASQLKETEVPEAIAATPENINIAKKIINSFTAQGGTNIIGALEVGLYLVKRVQEKYEEAYQPIIIFLTDGLPSVGIESTSQITSLILNINSKEYNTPIFTLCFGEDADWNFLQELSLSTNAKAKRIYVPDDIARMSDVSLQLTAFYETISTPVLSYIIFDNLPPSQHITQQYIPVFMNGSEIVIAGKGTSGKNTNPVNILAKGQEGFVNLQTKTGTPLTQLERIWAYLTIKQLIEKSHVNSLHNNTEFKKLALQLALNYSFVTEMTSMIVVKPNGINSRINVVDASYGIFSDSPNCLPMCDNITNWIAINIGTPESTTEVLRNTTTEVITTSSATVATVITHTDSRVLEIMPLTTEGPAIEFKEKSCRDMVFGCCHDGVTPAAGYNFSGCNPVPRPESCSLPINNGTCIKFHKNKSFKWAYNVQLGECRPFWYNGCGGNDNRFANETDCKRVCVDAIGPDRCKLPIISEPTLKDCPAKPEARWFYDQNKNDCISKMYFGCFGNSNRFVSQTECLEVCVPSLNRTQLQGWIAVNISTPEPTTQVLRDTTTEVITTSTDTVATVIIHIHNITTTIPDDVTTSTTDATTTSTTDGTTTSTTEATTTSTTDGTTTSTTEATTTSTTDITTSTDATTTIFTESATSTVSRVLTRENNVDVVVKSNFVSEILEIVPLTTEVPAIELRKKSCRDMVFGCCHDGVTPAAGHNFSGCNPVSGPESCSLPINNGRCRKFHKNKSFKWAYNVQLGECRPFWYNGCGGNDNRFAKEADCKKVCVNAIGPDRCKLPILSGPTLKYCPAKPEARWFYDQTKNDCISKMYFGCFGNSNRFSSQTECLDVCVPSLTRTHLQDSCSQKIERGNCTNYILKWAFNMTEGRCTRFWYGGCHGNANAFDSEESCKQRCANLSGRGIYKDPCLQEIERGTCTNYIVKWAFNMTEGRCTRFWYGGCNGNANLFDSEERCRQTCKSFWKRL